MALLHHHLEKSGWVETQGGDPLLDHHHAAVPGRSGELEAALMKTNDTALLILGLGESGLAMARWAPATVAPHASSWRIAPRRRRPGDVGAEAIAGAAAPAAAHLISGAA